MANRHCFRFLASQLPQLPVPSVSTTTLYGSPQFRYADNSPTVEKYQTGQLAINC